MKRQLIKSLLLVLAMSLTATSASAQRDHNYVKNQIKKWGTCKNVAITKTNGDVALYDKCGYAASSVPTGLLNKPKELNKSNTLIDDVQLTENGRWCVLYGRNDAEWTTNAPSGLVSKINEFHNNNYVVRSISFNDFNQWVIVSDEYYATSSTDLTNWLKMEVINMVVFGRFVLRMMRQLQCLLMDSALKVMFQRDCFRLYVARHSTCIA